MLDLKEPSWLTPAIPVEKAARCIVQGIARNRKIIVSLSDGDLSGGLTG